MIARNSSFAYRGKAVDVKKISKELGVHYVLEGSVRKAGKKIRVTAQLIDGISGKHVWAEKYDGDLQDIFNLQDQITQKVVASTYTQVALSIGEVETKVRRENIRTWELIAKAWKYGYDFTEDSLDYAEKLLRSALDLDSNSGMANCLLGSMLIHKVMMGYVPGKVRQIIDESYQFAHKAISIDEQLEFAHWVIAIIHLMSGKHDLALAEFQRTIEINPNFSLGYGALGSALALCGETEEAINNNEIAIRINPRDSSIFYRYSDIALSHFLAGRYTDAIEWSKKSIQRKSYWQMGHAILISSLGHLDRPEEAKRAIEDFRESFFGKRISTFKNLPFKYSEDSIKFQEGLRKAGLFEQIP